MKIHIRIVNRYGTFFDESVDGDIHQETDEFRKILADATVISFTLSNGSRIVLNKEMIHDSLFFIEPVQ